MKLLQTVYKRQILKQVI